MRKIVTLMLLVAGFVSVAANKIYAQDENIVNLQAEVRVDYQYEGINGDKIVDNTGFKGKYLNVILNGSLSKTISYSYRQRLNKAHSSQSFFDATDWIYLTYAPTEHWGFSAGKQVVAIGGFEYDRAPIDLYTCSEFWNNIPCYQFGVSASYKMNKGRDQLLFQVCQSPFRNVSGEDVYAYNLMWYGMHRWFNTAWSVNMIQLEKGEFINYIALGNYFSFGALHIYLDFMNRATSYHSFFFKDCSVMGEIAYDFCKKFKVFGKVTYDVNKSESLSEGYLRSARVADYCVLPGTELTMIGGGLEFYPLKESKNLRLHANCFYSTGSNGNPSGTMQDKRLVLDAGIKWKMNVLSLPRKAKK